MNTAKPELLTTKGSFWFPELIFDQAKVGTDGLFYFILICSTLLFLALIGLVGYFVYKYRRTETRQVATSQITHNDFIEIAWTLIPSILVLFIFYWGYKGFLTTSIPPEDAMEVNVVAKKWMWQFDYSNGTKSIGELVVPVNKPVKLVMTSEDVIHSFYLPNFRIKRDVVPNRYTRVWFSAKREGNFQLFCTEFCGDGHSEMLGVVRVLSEEKYQDWLKNAGVDTSLSPDKLGEKVYQSKGCNTCHSIDGSPKTGPSWKGIYGSTRTLASGQSVKADDEYIKESINNPTAKVVKGFQPVMPPFAGVLNEQEIRGVIEYMKKIK